MVVDPRAGHGPGIGGFKADSELGVAMRAGHPCYFVGFTPEPMPGQTIEDIMEAEAAFLEKVIALHPEAEGKPCVIGNCQAGWAVMMVAAIRPELFGPIIVPGSPLSYWAGVEGENPMRYTGGLAGGSWMTALDQRPGRRQVRRRPPGEELREPESGQYLLDQELRPLVEGRYRRAALPRVREMVGRPRQPQRRGDAVDRRPAVRRQPAGHGRDRHRRGDRIDLRNIRSPIVCFCSKGDNITPPPQALGWIVDLYGRDDDLRACGQTIVYAVHDTIGHLGIFVSGGVAKKEHQEFASNIDLIDVLPPGLYEAVMTPKTADTANAERVAGDWIVRFEPRTLADVRAIVQPDPENERRFAAVRRGVGDQPGLYRTLVQPFVQAAINEQGAQWLHKLNAAELPYRSSRKQPADAAGAQLAEQVREQRQPVSPDNPFAAVAAIDVARRSCRARTAIATCATAASSRSSWRSTARRCCRRWSG